MIQNLSMKQSRKIELEEDEIITSVSVFLIYGGKISITPLKNFVILTELTGYIPG